MASKKKAEFERSQGAVLAERLVEPRRFVQVVAGPRQVGKSTRRSPHNCACPFAMSAQTSRRFGTGLDQPAVEGRAA